MIRLLIDWSRLDVGSSRTIMSGALIRARAMATRCNWPPDSCLGLLDRYSWPRPTTRRVSTIRSSTSSLLLDVRSRPGSRRVVETLNLGFKDDWGCWKTI